MEVWGKGRGDFELYEDEDGNQWLWAACEVPGCKNRVCHKMTDRFCWPHLRLDASDQETLALLDRIAELTDVLIGAELVIRMLAPTGQETTLSTIGAALRKT